MIYHSDKKTVYAVGDIHGEFDGLLKFVKDNLTECDLIVCGDVGIGFEKPGHYTQLFGHMEKTLGNLGVNLYLFRGNHDDPKYYNYGYGNLGTEHIKVVPDYSVLMTEGGFTALMVGGAISVDRKFRIIEDTVRRNRYLLFHDTDEGFISTYWPNEEPIHDIEKMDALDADGIRIDCVCTHTCPKECRPPSNEFFESCLEGDPSLADDISWEGETMAAIRLWLKENHGTARWVFGHYHMHYEREFDGVRYTALGMYRRREQKPDIIELWRNENNVEFDNNE